VDVETLSSPLLLVLLLGLLAPDGGALLLATAKNVWSMSSTAARESRGRFLTCCGLKGGECLAAGDARCSEGNMNLVLVTATLSGEVVRRGGELEHLHIVKGFMSASCSFNALR
jgi:hypothetical protein